jgi:hypothetical protein
MAQHQRLNKEKEMFKIINEYLQSDKSQIEFCKRKGINYRTFQYWHKKYRKQQDGVLGNFVPVISVPKIEEYTPFRINYPNGVNIELPSDIGFEAIGSLIKLY